MFPIHGDINMSRRLLEMFIISIALERGKLSHFLENDQIQSHRAESDISIRRLLDICDVNMTFLM